MGKRFTFAVTYLGERSEPASRRRARGDMNYKKLVEFSILNADSISHNFKHFSFIVLRNKVMAIGFNNPNKTHPLAYRFGHRFACVHSELNAIINLTNILREKKVKEEMFRKCTMVNIRIDRNYRLRMSKPCKICEVMLEGFGIRNVVYSTNQGTFTKL